MSNYQTHALVGAACGAALAATLEGMQSPWCASPLLLAPCGMAGAGLTVASAAAALWPDLDEPQSWIARQWRGVCMVIGSGAGGWSGWLVARDVWSMLIVAGAIIGAIAGWALGAASLAALRRMALGHRGLTHSLITAGLMMGVALILHTFGASTWAYAAGLAAWGVVTHMLADVVTPEGVPLLAPAIMRRYRIAPAWLAAHSETVMRTAALLLILSFLRWP